MKIINQATSLMLTQKRLRTTGRNGSCCRLSLREWNHAGKCCKRRYPPGTSQQVLVQFTNDLIYKQVE